ncbi:dipeptidase PepE [Aliidiomarina haloalkalitolerans]|uniref:Dipeptidase PepE n=1 Tax=Aliidiomarina haloalkalitolerans TaxID=859059 RepID=A0A432VYA3_9GAMM|nr:dipeptidase PepE [Aliidiomarina haloalkalitolerans]RUO21693.1 dipeptidase PepE [Aliidiomarina haloalkalitolerans]
MRNLLLMSSSKYANTGYLVHSQDWLKQHFQTQIDAQQEILFISYAGVTTPGAEYTAKVAAALAGIGLRLRGIESYANARDAVTSAHGILVGGGNTFALLNELYRHGLIDLIKRQVQSGVPYAGWSAGANIAGLSIKTTNDMPIVQPPSFTALKLVNFQLNPHYIDQHPPGFHGETRAQRLAEFMELNPATAIIGLREGTALKVQQRMHLLGAHDGVYFRDGREHLIKAGQDCSFLLG